MRIAVAVVLALVLLVGSSPAQEAERNFAEANDLYRKGDHAAAAVLYEKILANGYEGAALYYNLGNARYKSGAIPEAILNYERALRLAPGDDDILHNLQLANLRIVDRIDPIPRLFLVEWWEALLALLPATGWGTLGIVLLWTAAVCLAAARLLRAPLPRRLTLVAGTALVLVAAFAFAAGGIRDGRDRTGNAAIVFAATTPVKSAPDAASTDLFVIHGGLKVELLDTVGEWKKIRLADGKVGWLPEGELRVI